MQRVTRLLAVSAAVLVCGLCEAENWPRFRGPNGAGIVDAPAVPVKWSKSDVRWTLDLAGEGHSSPVVWGDRVYVTSADTDASKRVLYAVNLADGAVVWKKEFPFAKVKKHSNNSFASNTPAVDADHVYLLQQGRQSSPLTAFTHDGEKVWEYDLGPYLHGQGPGTSPIVYKEGVLVSNDHKTGSFLLCVDRRTGKERWKIDREGKRACYSTPCVYDVPGRDPEIIFTHCFEGIVGVDPQSGRTHWTIKVFGTFPQRAVGSPIVAGDLVIGSSGARNGGKNVVAVRPDGSGEAKEVYRLDKAAPHVPTPLAYKEWLFLWSDGGVVSCHDAAGGKLIWRKRVDGTFFSSPICVNGRLYNIDLEGKVPVLAASDTFEQLALNNAGEGSRATMAVGGDSLLIRTYSKLIAIGGRD